MRRHNSKRRRPGRAASTARTTRIPPGGCGASGGRGSSPASRTSWSRPASAIRRRSSWPCGSTRRSGAGWGSGCPPRSTSTAFPAVRDHAASAIDLIFAEYLLREEQGERPPLEEFLRRFPEHADELKLQIELHREMDDDPRPTAAGSATAATLAGGERHRPSGPAHRRIPSIPGLRGPGRPGPGRHGDRLSRPAGRAEAPRGPEDAHRRRAGQPGGRGAVPGRGRGHGPAAAPEHRPDLPRRPARRRAVPGARAGRGPHRWPRSWPARRSRPSGRRGRWRRWRGRSRRRTGWGSCTATCRRPTS